MDYKWIFTLIATVGGWCITLGMYFAKVKHHDQEIKYIKENQKTNEALLLDISKQLADLNGKVSLLIQGKINIQGN